MNLLRNFTVQPWILSKGYAQGVVWACLTALVSVSNDVVTRFVGERLDPLQIGFFRYFFSLITILPYMIYRGKASFYTRVPFLHFLRAVVGVAAIALYIYGVTLLPLSEVVTLSFTQPLFFLPLAALLLKEHVYRDRWIATMIGFAGVLVVIHPHIDFNWVAMIPMGSAFLFACLDLLAKKMVAGESTTSLLFYFALGTTIAGFPPALFVWKTPHFRELVWLFFLGCGANLIQVCLFRAFAATDASSLAPFRYVEFVFAVLFGYFLFAEIPTIYNLIGAAIIVFSTLYLSYREILR